MDILNLNEKINEYRNESNKDDLDGIIEAFRDGHFTVVLTKTKNFRGKHEANQKLMKILSLLDATCHAQMGQRKDATAIIMKMYQHSHDKSIDDLLLYGSLAFMCDYKLARRIMSDAVKRVEKKETFDRVKAARAYLVLGEAEERLQKFIRAIRYYKQGLTYFNEEKEQDKQMILFLHFKLGSLHSSLNKIDEAIDYLQKTITLAGEDYIEIKMNSLVSIAKIYGRKNEFEVAYPYLNKAITMLEASSFTNILIHKEAYTEMAYHHFAQSKFKETIPYYEQAITIHLKFPAYSKRELGMIYMQYAYCLEHQDQSDKLLARKNYEKAYEQLEQVNDLELLGNAITDIIRFFDRTNNQKMKRFYENKLVKLTTEQARIS